MLKRRSGQEPNGAETTGGDVSARARKQPKLLGSQTQSDGTTAAATLNLQGFNSQEYGLDVADDFTWISYCNAEWSSATHQDLLVTPPVPAACQSGAVDEELPVQESSTALVYYGMVIPMQFPGLHWC